MKNNQTGKPSWSACDFDPTMRCASFPVPIDYHNADSPQIELPVAMKPAKDPTRKLGTLVVNFGGPGEHHSTVLAEEDPTLDQLQERFDLVAFDTRDTLLKCDSNLVNLQDAMPIVLEDQRAYQHRAQFNAALADSCRQMSGPLFDHVSSADIAHDVDEARKFLGEPQITFYGISYGTVIGQAYARTYPHNLRALILDSVVDQSLRATEMISSAARAQEENLLTAARLCEQDASCPVSGPAVRARLNAVFTAAQEGRLTGDAGVIRTDNLLKQLYMEGTEDTWRDKLELLNSYTIIEQSPGNEPYWPELPTHPGEPVPEPRPTTLLCTDWDMGTDTPQHATDLWNISKKAAPYTRGNAWYQEWTARCAGWPQPTSRSPQPQPTADNPPVLIVNSRYDVATSHEWAERTADRTSGARLVTYEGAGHGLSKIGSSCVTGHITRFATTLRLPAKNATCASVHGPASKQPNQARATDHR
ncbi:alpha/beta hydrolase [Streptomyces klenkii]|uniref:alpha/beta hydrolase n=1 Tax=Streptomyces klenkii TaxID=1420899 RepID=UPI003425A79A